MREKSGFAGGHLALLGVQIQHTNHKQIILNCYKHTQGRRTCFKGRLVRDVENNIGGEHPQRKKASITALTVWRNV
jgi:hypothetical protein